MLPRLLTRRAMRLACTTSRTSSLHQPQPSHFTLQPARSASHVSPTSLRHLSSTTTLRATPSNKSPADDIIEEITELYATAQDEFEIAMEETEKVSVYAEDDRAAAREELEKVKEAFRKVVEGEDKEVAEEVQRRIGQRIRELEQGVGRMEEIALEQD